MQAGGQLPPAATARLGSARVPDCAQVRFTPEEGPRTCRSPDTAAALGWKLSPTTQEPTQSHSARDFRRDLQNKTWKSGHSSILLLIFVVVEFVPGGKTFVILKFLLSDKNHAFY